MKFRIFFIIVFCFLANVTKADEVFFTKDRCLQIKSTIQNLILTSDRQWEKLLPNPSNKNVALELSWTMNLAENYSNIYSFFCTKK